MDKREKMEEDAEFKEEFMLNKKAREARYNERQSKRDTIRRDLNRQLKDMGASHSHYRDLVLDYMSLWDIKSELIHDIRVKGVSLMYKNGANQYGWKKNDSVSELNKVNGQMLKILNDLSLRPADIEEDDEDEFIL